MSAGTEKRAYHHGDLRDELMSLAIEEIAEHGTERLSLRSLARKAEVSQTAPYRHFPTKTCLLAALATQGFNKLRRSVSDVVNTNAPIEQRFLDMGVAYVTFALNNRVLYQLMFGGVIADFSVYQDLRDASEACYAQVSDCETQLREAKGLTHDPDRLGGAIWAGVHGVASLLLNVSPSEHYERDHPRKAVAAMHSDIEDTMRILFGHLTH